jgi:polar amino acid transport system substrate-binding protein
MNVTTISAAMLTATLVAFAPMGAGAQETIKKIKSAGIVRVCISESRPMALKNPATGEWSGYNARMAGDLAGALGVKLELVDQPYATIIPSLLTSKCDVVMAPLFANAERAQVVAFTNFYSSQGLKMLVADDAKYKTWEELDNPSVTFAAPSGTQNESFTRQAFPKAKLRPIVSENSAAYLLELAARRVDAVATDANSARVFLAENPQAKLKLLQPERTANPTGRAYAVRPDDWHFLNFMNVWLEGAKDKYSQDQ